MWQIKALTDKLSLVKKTIALLRDTLIFLITIEARMVLWRHKPKIIAVTGNLGKTSAKDAIFCGLTSQLSIGKSEKSFNSDLGVPLAILGLENPWMNPFKWIAAFVRGLTIILTDLSIST